MKFYCDQCSAKYSIPDEKVRGKVVKVRCKECDHVISVRGNQRKKTGTDDGRNARVSSSAGKSSPSTGPQKAVQWYYSYEGETHGPHPESELREKYLEGEIPPASYVWRDGFSDWKPAEDVEPFSEAIASTRDSQHPRRSTQGVGGDALEAVEPADQDSTGSDSTAERGTGTDSESASARTSEAPRARTGGNSGESTRSTDSGTGRKERLERLRSRLQSSFGESDEQRGRDSSVQQEKAEIHEEHNKEDKHGDKTVEKPMPEDFDDIDVDVDAASSETDATSAETGGAAAERSARADTGGPSTERTTTDEGLGPSPDAGELDRRMETGAEQQPAGETGPEDVTDADEDDFDLPPAGSDRLGGQAPTPEADQKPGVDVEEHDGLFDGVDQETEQPAQDDEERDTEIPTAPKLGDDDESSKSLRDSVSESLLIQIDNIKKTDRSTYYKWGIAAVALIAALGGAWWYLYNPDAAANLFGGADQQESRTEIAGNELEFQTYSDDEVLNIGATEVPKSVGTAGAESAGSEGSESGGGGSAQQAEGSAGGGDEVLSSGTDELFAEDEAGLQQALAQSNSQKAKAGGSNSGGSVGGGGSAGDQPKTAKAKSPESGSEGESDPFAGIGAIDSPTAESSGGPNIEAPEDNLQNKDDEASNLSSQLSKERISRAIRNVGKSVGTCRRRHARHGAPLEAKKITIVFTVQRDGRVSAFQISPKSVRSTRFEKCMQARKGRWNFGPIPNAPQQMKAPFILQ